MRCSEAEHFSFINMDPSDSLCQDIDVRRKSRTDIFLCTTDRQPLLFSDLSRGHRDTGEVFINPLAEQ